ncbi:LuxR C-terminal-related transcriptional regulator [Microbacterium aurugineum]|uniref:response regulator transcription factor n=1 Tax=Microbacterium TaxID=33882 RepID=UPI001040543A|nr:MULTISPECIES: LuxR C-terminal-related transcriptional regulator [Microbacterium]MCE0509695.1 LuxR C-terminal-related transcriptional regulator [Microbacterium sp. KKR3/1]MCK8467837.1 LuxR C-terminal-related transcriptional regulator [Microbacterium aurugineum]QEA27853.1 response regulator transcription factor [Microbacterium sp. CBA3102]TCJ22495.1 response regulator transcription factor [Microbacterium sp. PI-1]
MPIRVGIIDNQPALVLGITVLINAQPDMTFVCSARSVRELLSAGKTLDVVLVDPAIGGPLSQPPPWEALVSRGIGVLVFSGVSPMLSAAQVPGSAGVESMRKTDPLHRVIAGIRATQRNRSAARELDSSTRTPLFAPEVALSPREREVLELYATGYTAAQVGEALGISRNTVVDHIKGIRRKYVTAGRPAFTKVDLFRRAVEDGLVPDGSV